MAGRVSKKGSVLGILEHTLPKPLQDVPLSIPASTKPTTTTDQPTTEASHATTTYTSVSAYEERRKQLDLALLEQRERAEMLQNHVVDAYDRARKNDADFRATRRAQDPTQQLAILPIGSSTLDQDEGLLSSNKLLVTRKELRAAEELLKSTTLVVSDAVVDIVPDPGYLKSTMSMHAHMADRILPTTMFSASSKKEGSVDDTSLALTTTTSSPKEKEKKRKADMTVKDEPIDIPAILLRNFNFLRNPRFREHPPNFREMLSAYENFVTDDGTQIETTLFQGKYTFAPVPPVVRFPEYEAGMVFEQVLQIQNRGSIMGRIKVIPPASMFFSVSLVQYPGEDGLVAPGMHCQLMVRFHPDTLADFEDVLTILTEQGKMAIPLIARRRPPNLTISDTIDCGSCFVHDLLAITIPCKNLGGAGRFLLIADSEWPNPPPTVHERQFVDMQPFRVQPAHLVLAPGDSVDVRIEFAPPRPGKFSCGFRLVCDNCSVQQYTLTGSSFDPWVVLRALDGDKVTTVAPVPPNVIPLELHFPPIGPGSVCIKRLRYQNASPLPLSFSWILKDIPTPQTRSRAYLQRWGAGGKGGGVVNLPPVFAISPQQGTFQPSAPIDFELKFRPVDTISCRAELQLLLEGLPSSAPLMANALTGPSGSPRSPATSPMSKNGRRNKLLLANGFDSVASSSTNLLVPAGGGVTATISPLSGLPGFGAAGVAFEDRIVAHVTVSGTGEMCDVKLIPQVLAVSAPLSIGRLHSRTVRIINSQSAAAEFSWEHYPDMVHQAVSVRPDKGVLQPGEERDLEVVCAPKAVGILDVNLHCHISFGLPVMLRFRASIVGPIVKVREAALDFGLVQVGKKIQKQITLTNVCDVLGRWSLQFEERSDAPPKSSSNNNENGLAVTTDLRPGAMSPSSTSTDPLSPLSANKNNNNNNNTDLSIVKVGENSKVVVANNNKNNALRTSIRFSPSHGILEPGASVTVTATIDPKHCQRLRGVTVVQIEAGTPQYLSTRAEIQEPKVCLSVSSLELGEIFVKVPKVVNVICRNLTLLPTRARWDSTNYPLHDEDGPEYAVSFKPASVELGPLESTRVQLTIVGVDVGASNTLKAYIACDVDGMQSPLGLMMSGRVMGLVVTAHHCKIDELIRKLGHPSASSGGGGGGVPAAAAADEGKTITADIVNDNDNNNNDNTMERRTSTSTAIMNSEKKRSHESDPNICYDFGSAPISAKRVQYLVLRNHSGISTTFDLVFGEYGPPEEFDAEEISLALEEEEAEEEKVQGNGDNAGNLKRLLNPSLASKAISYGVAGTASTAAEHAIRKDRTNAPYVTSSAQLLSLALRPGHGDGARADARRNARESTSSSSSPGKKRRSGSPPSSRKSHHSERKKNGVSSSASSSRNHGGGASRSSSPPRTATAASSSVQQKNGGSSHSSSMAGGRQQRYLLSDEHEANERFRSAHGKALHQFRSWQDQQVQVLARNKGAAFVAYPASGIIGPWEDVQIQVSMFADMCGHYDDVLECRIAGLEPKVIPIKAVVEGRPVFLEGGTLGLNLSTMPPVASWGTLLRSSPAVNRTLRVANTSPHDVRIRWDLLTEAPPTVETGLITFSSFVDAQGSISVSVAARSAPKAGSEAPFIVTPATLVIPARSTSAVNVACFKEDADAKVEFHLVGDVRVAGKKNGEEEGDEEEDDGEENGTTKIDSSFGAEEEEEDEDGEEGGHHHHPRGTLIPDRKKYTVGDGEEEEEEGDDDEEENEVRKSGSSNKSGSRRSDNSNSNKKKKSNGMEIAPIHVVLRARVAGAVLDTDKSKKMRFVCFTSDPPSHTSYHRSITLTNREQMTMSFSLRAGAPFSIESTSSTTPILPEGQPQPPEGQPQTYFTLPPGHNVAVGLKFTPPAKHRTRVVEDATFNHNLTVSFSNGEEQQFPLEALLYHPELQLDVESIQFGTSHVDYVRTLVVTLTNPTYADAHWSVAHQAKVYQTSNFMQSLTATGGAGAGAGGTTSIGGVTIATGTGASSTTAAAAGAGTTKKDTVEDEPECFVFEPSSGIVPGRGRRPEIPRTMTVKVHFHPKKNVRYQSRFRFNIVSGRGCELQVEGTGSFDEQHDLGV